MSLALVSGLVALGASVAHASITECEDLYGSDESQCSSAFNGRQACLWNGTYCTTINCGNYQNEGECSSFSDYACTWFDFDPSIDFGVFSIEDYCYTNWYVCSFVITRVCVTTIHKQTMCDACAAF